MTPHKPACQMVGFEVQIYEHFSFLQNLESFFRFLGVFSYLYTPLTDKIQTL